MFATRMEALNSSAQELPMARPGAAGPMNHDAGSVQRSHLDIAFTWLTFSVAFHTQTGTARVTRRSRAIQRGTQWSAAGSDTVRMRQEGSGLSSSEV